jgi:Phosphoinositide phospholipase C, Ca2+-dependent
MKNHHPVLKAATLVAFVAASAFGQSADHARMNEVQVLGSHNSYHVGIAPSLLTVIRQEMGTRIRGLEYSHSPIQQQLDQGLRALEIDVVNDPAGGFYAHPKGLDMVRESGLPADPPYDPEGLMNKPGLKVIHVPDIDFRSNAYTLQQELGILKAWSDAHPRHVPISITMNAKDDGIDKPGFVRPVPFDRAAFDNWDSEIVKGLGRDKLIIPDDVRGNYPTLEAAVLAHAWPTLGKARGKFFFVLDETGKKLDTYVEGHPSLKGRAMFVNATEGRPEAAFRIVNEPKQDWVYIQYLVRSGFYVRTRADAETVEARKGDYSRWRAALISGAQVISTDYYCPDPKLHTGYHVQFSGDVRSRWNPLLLPPERPLPSVE